MNLKPLLFFPPVALGVLGFIWMTSGAQPPIEAGQEVALAVRTTLVQPRTVTPSSVAYGRVEAETSWTALAEVQGRVVALLPGLAVGTMVASGEVLAEIDPTDYRISRDKAQANLASAQTQLSQLDREEENTRRSLVLEQSNLAITQAEFDRVRSLVDRGTSTESALDTARRALLQQQGAITNLTNTLALYPTRRATAEATLAVRQAELIEAERALEKTQILAPFDGRITTSSIELGQYVRQGDSLIVLDSTEAAEITAEIQPRTFRPLIGPLVDQVPTASPDTEDVGITLLHEAGVQAFVSFPGVDGIAPWPAEIVRLRGTADNQTGALGLVVRVADPTRIAPDIRRPPLTTGSFVEVTFQAAPRAGVLTVPRTVLQRDDDGNAFVFLVDGDSRLAVQPVKLGAVLGSDVIVESGLTGGETLILSDPRPPVVGLKLTPVPDQAGQ